MAKVSKDTARGGGDYGPVVDRHEEVDGYRIGFTEFRENIDGTPLMKGLPAVAGQLWSVSDDSREQPIGRGRPAGCENAARFRGSGSAS